MKFEIKMPPCTIVELFDAVAKEMGYADTSEIKYDCTKINVASNIQDGFYTAYGRLLRESDPNIPYANMTIGITMYLAISGPKVNNTLKENEIEVFDGFIIESEA